MLKLLPCKTPEPPIRNDLARALGSPPSESDSFTALAHIKATIGLADKVNSLTSFSHHNVFISVFFVSDRRAYVHCTQ
jgi:hypothetical protein